MKKIGGVRTGTMEVLLNNPAVASYIREGKIHQLTSAIQLGMKQGMILMNDALLKLVVSRVVDPQQALYKAIDRDDFTKKLMAAGVPLGASRAARPSPLDQRKELYARALA